MNRLSNILNVLTLLLITAGIAFSQEVEYKKQIKQANSLFDKGAYEKALPLYTELASNYQPGTIKEEVLFFNIGFCYYNSLLEREQAIPWFEKYLEITDSIYDTHYFLAKSYHLHHRFEEAITQYEIFEGFVKNDSLNPSEIIERVLASVNYDIERCNYGKVLINNPVDAIIENLGEDINTPHAEYAPVISPDEKKLVFTRRDPETTGGKVSPDGDYYEDIYITTLEEGSLFSVPTRDTGQKAGFSSLTTAFKFSPPEKISPNINSKTHEGAIQFSYDGKKLFIYRDFNVWVSEFTEGAWTTPSTLGNLKTILNAKAYEPSVSISVNGDAIYFSSDRTGGHGGLDIYKSTMQEDGTWSVPENLGPEINTVHDEDSPYIDPDGRTLYFSSSGHSSMGGYDVFKTVFKNGSWNQPKNIGYPVNSAGDDIFFMMTPRYNRGYYSSDQPGGYGKMDLYRLTFAKERPPLAEIKGLVLKGDTLLPAYSKLTIYDPKTGDTISTHYSDSVSGEYLLLFAHGHGYKINVETDGFAPYEKGFSIPEQVDYFQYYQEIHHVYLRDKLGNIIGQQITMYNASFDNDSMAMDTVMFAKNSAGAIAEMIHAMKKNKLVNIQELADVKFYISQDSILSLKKKYPDLEFHFPDSTSISFLDTSLSKDISVLKAYVSVDEQFLVLTSATTEEDIEETLKPEDKAAKIPSILVYFDYKSDDLQEEMKQTLSKFVTFLQKNEDLKFEVIGHTDSIGSQEYNITLSLERAESVVGYLTRNDLQTERFKIVGKGKSEPVAPNQMEDGSDNPEGRKLNRRVEFKLMSKTGH